jgi:formylglycine-generating enzyme required for sulfatase activity/tRNA A-37 threonylcarbamoyl transferase component Bud32
MFDGSARASPDWTPPDEFEDYRLLRPIGQGAFGRVYLAEDLLLCRPVAVKFLNREPDQALREQFFVEARAVARLSHPNVVAIYRVGEIKRRPYLVSEYLRGQSLDKLDRALTPAELHAVALGLTCALAAAHRRGVLHRDLKPANAIRTEDGEVKLLDFGLAKTMDGPCKPGDKEPLVGSPMYMVPELWDGEPASVSSDLYALGVLLFELATHRLPWSGQTVAELHAAMAGGATPPSVAQLAPEVDPRLAAAIDRCLRRTPGERFPSADALRDVLEDSGAAAQRSAVPLGNPYRGLSAFDAEHRGSFFGREADERVVLDRLRSEPLVVVVADSGVGKSSLCAAGIVPLAVERCGWTPASLLPGKHPLAALCCAVAPLVGLSATALFDEVQADPLALADAIRRAAAGEMLLFIDQMEELLTMATPDEARAVGIALGGLAARAPGVRLLGTVRSDFLSRLAALPGVGDGLGRAVHLLRPLSAEGMREAIVGPARERGVQFESEALVESLIDSAQGGLPFLQFALAELWESRDQAAGLIRASSLEAIGGVRGALARHADRLLEALLPVEREAARGLLLSLVTPDGTRTRVGRRHLVGDRDQTGRAALEALVRGRLLVAHEGEPGDGGAYEIAHEALLQGWDTLRGWLSGDRERQLVRQRLGRAADEWARLGGAPELLFGERQLRETTALVDAVLLGEREAEFLSASRRALWWRKLRRWSLPAGALFLVATAIGGASWNARRDLRAAVRARLSDADVLSSRARASSASAVAEQARAFAAFDGQDWPKGEAVWRRALELDREVDALYASASSVLEAALALDPGRASVRDGLADTLYARMLWAERGHRNEVAIELAARLPTYDLDGTRAHRLNASAEVALQVTPADASISVQRYDSEDGRLVPSDPRAASDRMELPPGSYLFSFRAAGRVNVDLPVLLRRGERVPLAVKMPPVDAVPDGFVYVPAGRFLFGSADAEEVRHDLGTVPLHDVSTPAYLIARHEVTFGEWIEFLRALPTLERHRRTPVAQSSRNALELRELPDGAWELALRPTNHTYAVRSGEPFHYLGRDRRAVQDWARFPVAAISYDDALAYAAWLDTTGRVRGARLCNEYEWERAARGADGRQYPSGMSLAPDDANRDVTYGRQPFAFGPDEAGSHPGSRSPFGVDDLAGNVWEWVQSVARPGEVAYRGGSWYQGDISSRSDNREIGERTTRHPFHGVRMCAAAPD